MNPIHSPEPYEFLYETSSRNRILITAKTLFASLGYDNASTALIARNAGTSESQLMKHFGGKAGVLESIFATGWEKINERLVECFEAASDFNGRLSCIPAVIGQQLGKDVELKTLLLLEGHRLRDAARADANRPGYARFLKLVDQIVSDAQANGEIPADMPVVTLRSGILGIVDGGIREDVLATRANFPANYTPEEFTTVVSGFLRRVASGDGQGAAANGHLVNT